MQPPLRRPTRWEPCTSRVLCTGRRCSCLGGGVPARLALSVLLLRGPAPPTRPAPPLVCSGSLGSSWRGGPYSWTTCACAPVGGTASCQRRRRRPATRVGTIGSPQRQTPGAHFARLAAAVVAAHSPRDAGCCLVKPGCCCPSPALPPAGPLPPPAATSSAYFEAGGRQQTPAYLLSDLRPGQAVPGEPCLPPSAFAR